MPCINKHCWWPSDSRSELAVWSSEFSPEDHHYIILHLSPSALQFGCQISACSFNITGQFWEWKEWKKLNISKNEFFKMLVSGMLQVLHCLKKWGNYGLVHLMSCRLEIYKDSTSIEKIKQIMVVSAFLHSSIGIFFFFWMQYFTEFPSL